NYEKVVQYGLFDDPNFIADIKFRIASLKAEQLLAKNSNNANAFLMVANAALHNEQFKQAEKAFIKALYLNKNIASGHTGLGLTFLQQGKPFNAEDEFKEALKLNSRDAEAYMGLATLQKRRLDYPLAISYAQKAINSAPNESKYRTELGKIYLDKQDFSRAITELNKVNTAESNYWLGVTYLTQSNDSEAKKYFLKSLGQNPYDARPYKDLGKIFINEGELFEARNYLEDAIGLDTNYADAYFLLGVIDEMEGDKILAANNFIISYTIDPTSVDAYKKAYKLFEAEGEMDKFFLPRPKFVPNEEEREYIIKLFYIISLRNKAQINYYDNILTHCRYGLNMLSSDYEGLYALRSSTANLLGKTKGIYTESLNLIPPKRFVPVHQQWLDALWWDTNSLYKQLYVYELGIYSTNKKYQEIKEKVNNVVQTAEGKLMTFNNDLISMLNKWDSISLDEVLTASGYDIKEIKTLQEKSNAVTERTDEAFAILSQKGYSDK
ncbi:MAG: tetratricopeptide repeat protein, partial [Cyanobacteriota bacterium]